jgi:DNA polymerase III delta prime subunit
MFENIIGHKEIVETLRGELSHGTFPRASLFYGPAYAGKLSTALEVARVLTCAEGTADWACECQSCRLQKELAHPHTVLLGSRYADVEIAACAGALLRSRKTSTQYLFLRAVRKLTRRFDPSVMDTDDARMKGAPDKVSRLEELLAGLEPGGELPAEKQLGDLLEKIVAAAMALSAHLRGDGITVGQVRRVAVWAHETAASASRKVAIIENADRMQDSARNALLKLLEEPPEAVTIIMLATRRAAIIPTILSRLRPYSFEDRTPADEIEVMKKIFREDAPAQDSLRAFFLAWREINPEKLAALSRQFMERVGAGESGAIDIGAEMAELFPARKPSKDAVSSFLEELTLRFAEQMRRGEAGLDTLDEWTRAVRDAQSRLEIYNMSPQTVVETLYYRMRDAARERPEVEA